MMPPFRKGRTNQQTEEDTGTGDDDQDDDTEWEEDTDHPDKLRAANNEAKRRRLQAKEANTRAEAANTRADEAERELARLKGERAAPTDMMPILKENALLKAGVPADRIGSAVRAFNADGLDTSDDYQEAAEEFLSENAYFLDSRHGGKEQEELPSTGSRHNNNRKRPTQTSDASLFAKYPGLGHR